MVQKRKKILNNIPGLKVLAISDKNPKNRIKSKDIKFFDNYKKLFKEDLDISFVILTNKYDVALIGVLFGALEHFLIEVTNYQRNNF